MTGVLAAAKILPLTKFLSHTEHIRKVIRRVSSTKTCRGFFLPRPPITSRRSSHAPRRRALGALSPVSSSSSLVETHLCQDVLHQRLPLRQRRSPTWWVSIDFMRPCLYCKLSRFTSQAPRDGSPGDVYDTEGDRPVKDQMPWLGVRRSGEERCWW